MGPWLFYFLVAALKTTVKYDENYTRARDYEVREHIPVSHDDLFQSILSFAPLFLDSSRPMTARSMVRGSDVIVTML